MLMDRDVELLCTLEDIHYITPTLASGIIYPNPVVARKRLLRLMRAGYLNRVPTGVGREALYYLKERPTPSKADHILGIINLWHRATLLGGLESFRVEQQLDGPRPDAIIRHQNGLFFYEYERTSPPSVFAGKVRQYEAWVREGDWRGFGTLPTMLVETPRVEQVKKVLANTATLPELRWVVGEAVDYVFAGSAGREPVGVSGVRWRV